MKNSLIVGMQKSKNVAYTANGALSNKSTLNDVLDLFYHAPARRGQNNTKLFADAYSEDSLLALKTIFYVRDIRGGQGERETFRQALRWLYKNDLNTFEKIVILVPVYGRWDDVLEYVDNRIVRNIVIQQLRKDRFSDNPSLLAKWMPMANTHGNGAKATANRVLASKWANALGLTEANYRRQIVAIRKNLNLVETLMSSGQWDKINFEHVPSRAGMLLRKAFSKRQAERYVAYLESVKKGDKKINASTLYPYEIVAKVMESRREDDTLEAQWNALPDYCEGDESNAMVIADVSGSMNGVPIQVSISLALYIAERNKGAFHNYFMVFSGTSELIAVKGKTLKAKINHVQKSDTTWGQNTNLKAAFDSILHAAIKNNVPESDMPKKLFIISDMQFDHSGANRTNFEVMKAKYANAGYILPTVVFWNVNSTNKEAPVTLDQRGVYLVSGASPSIFKAAINTRAINPMEMLLDVINSDRYAAIEEALLT
jgi:hypothetical protein